MLESKGGVIKMKFNYKKAWDMVARKEFTKLPKEVKSILESVATQYANIGQLKNLDMPEIEDIKARMSMLSSYMLSKSAMVIHALGHWKYKKVASLEKYIIAGSAWKYANLCDQILRDRLWLSRNHDYGHGLHIVDGELCLHYSNKDCWVGDRIGYATESNASKAQQIIDSVQKIGIEKYESALQICTDTLPKTVMHNIVDLFPVLLGDNDNTEKENQAIARKLKAEFRKNYSLVEWKKKKAVAEIELNGKLWFIEHGLDYDNLIYYKHTGRFNFGWRKSIKHKEGIITKLEGFSYPIDIV
jgi:hypothetical protein